MANELLKLIVSFLLVTVIGAWLTQRWQLRNWLAQQKVADKDQKYNELKLLYDDLDRLGNKRIFRTRRLAWALLSGRPDLIEDRLKAYDEAMVDWNERYNGLYIRFVRNLEEGTSLFNNLEENVNIELVNSGRVLDAAVRQFREAQDISYVTKKEIKLICDKLELLNSNFIWVLRDIYKALQSAKNAKFSFLGLDDYADLRDLQGPNVTHVGLLKFIFKPRE